MAKPSVSSRVEKLERSIEALDARLRQVESQLKEPEPPPESTPESRAPVTLVEGVPEPPAAPTPSVESKPAPEEQPPTPLWPPRDHDREF